MPRVKMLNSTPFAVNGINVQVFKKDHEYELPKNIARVLVNELHAAEYMKSENKNNTDEIVEIPPKPKEEIETDMEEEKEEKEEKESPKNKDAGDSPKDKSGSRFTRKKK